VPVGVQTAQLRVAVPLVQAPSKERVAMARSLEELLTVLSVRLASAVTLRNLQTTVAASPAKKLLTSDPFGGFSEGSAVSLSLDECALLKQAGAVDERDGL